MLKKAADSAVLAAYDGKKQVDFVWLIRTYEKIAYKFL